MQRQQSKGPLGLAVLMIAVGSGWLLADQGYAPDVDWVWTLALAAVGILAFVLSGGVDKVSIIVGPFFLAGSLLSILRQTDRLRAATELPVLVILLGVLLLVAQSSWVPLPRWFVPPPGEADRRDRA